MTAGNAHLCDRLRVIREMLGLTQAVMATQMGISLRAYQTYEAGQRQPKASDVAGLVGVGIDLNWLLTGVGQMMREAAPAAPPPIDEQLLAETLRLVDDWLAANRRVMTPERKAQAVAAIYALMLEDAAEGRPSLDARRVGHILKLAG